MDGKKRDGILELKYKMCVTRFALKAICMLVLHVTAAKVQPRGYCEM